MTPIPDFKITNSIRFRGELKNQVLRRFKEGVRKSIKEGESVTEIFNKGKGDPMSRRAALEVAGKTNVWIHLGQWQAVWDAEVDVV